MGKLGASRHVNFYVSILLGLVAGVAALLIDGAIGLPVGVNVFFLAYLVLTARASRKFTSEFLRKHASDEDEPAPFILLVMLAAVTAAAVSLFLVLMDSSNRLPVRLPLGVASVVLGWFAVHTMWAVHYAYEYYRAIPGEASGKTKSAKVRQGLDFPGGEDPNGVAFVYFAYVVGMTAQTADTNITSNAMRRLVVVHSVFSFFFNTIIVAAAVNIAVALAQ